jgi:hypothetical protein
MTGYSELGEGLISSFRIAGHLGVKHHANCKSRNYTNREMSARSGARLCVLYLLADFSVRI